LEEYALYTGITEKQALLSGVPFFDQYFRNDVACGDHIVYIEQPYLEPGLLNWNMAHHKKIADTIRQFSIDTGRRVYIKLHPRSDRSLWESYSFDPNLVQVVQHGDFTDVYLSAALILGYSSSLITALLCAKKNVVLLGWHPSPHIFGADFSRTGLCHVSFFPEELKIKFSEWAANNLAIRNKEAHDKFLYIYNYPFNGKATERVLNAIVTNENS
jgi:hypothetical protein